MNQKCKEAYLETRAQTMHLVNGLEVEDFVVQPITDVSPPKWHLAHTTWFFEEFILKKYVTNYQVFDDVFSYLFNSYYVAVGERWQRAKRGNLTRPTVAHINSYRKYVDTAMSRFLKATKIDKALHDLLEIGINHEQQHQELLLTDIKYILGTNPIFPPLSENLKVPLLKEEIRGTTWVEVKGGLYEVGHCGENFHFDNEKGMHQVHLNDFQYQDRLVTNGEYLEFIEHGGYQKSEYWMMEGFEVMKKNQILAPLYWMKENAEWYYYTLSGFRPIDLNCPVVHVSFYEADAYARWKEARLLTEFEWEVACKCIYLAKDNITKKLSGNFVDEKNYQPMPVQGGHQFFGDCWEWTNSAYLPYPNYKKLPGALGEYNGKFMINQMVLRGGSCATPQNHIRTTYRNFFPANARWQFSGFRLAK